MISKAYACFPVAEKVGICQIDCCDRANKSYPQSGRRVMCSKGEAHSRPFPTMREGIRQSARPGRCGTGQRETVREKRLNHFHHIKVSSLCPQFVRTLSAVAFRPVTRMVAGFC